MPYVAVRFTAFASSLESPEAPERTGRLEHRFVRWVHGTRVESGEWRVESGTILVERGGAPVTTA